MVCVLNEKILFYEFLHDLSKIIKEPKYQFGRPAIPLKDMFFSCGLTGEWSKDEVARVVSPSGKVDAVLLETNGGATTSFGYEVYVVERGAEPIGEPAVFLYGAIRNQSAYGVNLKWESQKLSITSLLSWVIRSPGMSPSWPYILITGQIKVISVKSAWRAFSKVNSK